MCEYTVYNHLKTKICEKIYTLYTAPDSVPYVSIKTYIQLIYTVLEHLVLLFLHVEGGTISFLVGTTHNRSKS